MGKKMQIVLIVAGAVVAAFLCLLFSGFGIWSLPGLVMIAAGAAGMAGKGKRLGLGILLCGAALFVAAIPHILLGWVQIVAVIVAAVGAIGMLIGKKA